MRAPIPDLCEKIIGSVDDALFYVRTGLQQRSDVASTREVLQLLLDTIHVVSKNLPFIENMEKGIQTASVLLDACLGRCFVDGLNNSDTSVLYNCIRCHWQHQEMHKNFFVQRFAAPLIHRIIAH